MRKPRPAPLLGDKQGLRDTWEQHRTYFDC